jgi:hypothetical protein
MTGENAIKVKNGTKTQTRRCQGLEKVNENPADWVFQRKQEDGTFVFLKPLNGLSVCKPRYHVGDIVPIREPHYLYGFWATVGISTTGKSKWQFVPTASKGTRYPDNKPGHTLRGFQSETGWYLRPGLFMSHWDVRTHVRITEVRCQRVNQITPEDCKAEGYPEGLTLNEVIIPPKIWFMDLWDSINGGKPKKGKPDLSFNRGPWCFPYNVEKVEG